MRSAPLSATLLSALVFLAAPAAGHADDDAEATNANQSWLLVEAVPVGATVIVDETFDGVAPFRVLVSPGEHEVRVGQHGFLTASREIRIEPGEDQRLSVLLERDPEQTYVGTGNLVFWGGLGAGAAMAGIGHWGAASSAERMRAGELTAQGENRGYSILAITGYAVAVVGAVLGPILWQTPKRYRTGYVCYDIEQTGSRLPQHVCESR